MIKLKVDEQAIISHFNTEEACEQFLFLIKWPEGFLCPRCGHNHSYTIKTRRIPLYQCRNCRYQTSVITGTIMEGSRTSLRKWLHSIYLVSRMERGINAVQLSTLIQVTYKTAWSILRKIRQAITQADDRQPLSGLIRGGFAVYRPPYCSILDLPPQHSPLFAVASLDSDDAVVQLKLKIIPSRHMNTASALPSGHRHFIEQHVSTEADVINIETKPFRFPRIALLRKYFREARSWINKTFNGIGPKYLQNYLDEYCLRLNTKFQNRHLLHYLTRICLGAPI
ncbi:transposase [Paenibacillus sp. J2TS4]|uniref:transposase n=1 Tax=Paenibacillus sp. J2TS4 TaxID=2807194 RepID=UPI001BCFD051|nr:transposase [Paenibacillus sp. J2TS4]